MGGWVHWLTPPPPEVVVVVVVLLGQWVDGWVRFHPTHPHLVAKKGFAPRIRVCATGSGAGGWDYLASFSPSFSTVRLCKKRKPTMDKGKGTCKSQ